MQSHSNLAPAPHAGHQLGHILLWDVIPFFNQQLSQVSQCGCAGHSGKTGPSKLTPQMFKGVEGRTADRPLCPLTPKYWRLSLINPTHGGQHLVPDCGDMGY